MKGEELGWMTLRAETAERAVSQVRRVCNDVSQDNSMHLAPGWMVRDAIVAKVLAALSETDDGE